MLPAERCIIDVYYSPNGATSGFKVVVYLAITVKYLPQVCATSGLIGVNCFLTINFEHQVYPQGVWRLVPILEDNISVQLELEIWSLSYKGTSSESGKIKFLLTSKMYIGNVLYIMYIMFQLKRLLIRMIFQLNDLKLKCLQFGCFPIELLKTGNFPSERLKIWKLLQLKGTKFGCFSNWKA